MYNVKDIQFVGKHDYDKEAAEKMASGWSNETFSIGIFQWRLKNNGKSMKRGKALVRVQAPKHRRKEAFEMAEGIVQMLDAGAWDGRKTVRVTW